MIELEKSVFAVMAPLMILSLAPATFAGNEPVQQPIPKTRPAIQTTVMDRPEMASFKRIQMFAFKYRQKLSNLEVTLSQALRVKIISEASHKKLQEELQKLNEAEPALARGGWKQSDVDAFDKQIAKYEDNFEKANAPASKQGNAPAPVKPADTKTPAKK